MAAEAEGLARGPSQIKALIAVVIAILSVKGMAGDAYDSSLIIKDHIGRDLYGRGRAHGMRPHFIGAVMPWMARAAYLADITAKRQPLAGEGKAGVAFDACHLQQAFMRHVLAVRGGRGEQDGQYDTGSDHRLKAPICCSMALITPAMFWLMAMDSVVFSDVLKASAALARSAV